MAAKYIFNSFLIFQILSVVNENRRSWIWYKLINDGTRLYCFFSCCYIEYELLSKLCFSKGRISWILQICFWLVTTLGWFQVNVHGKNGLYMSIMTLGSYVVSRVDLMYHTTEFADDTVLTIIWFHLISSQNDNLATHCFLIGSAIILQRFYHTIAHNKKKIKFEDDTDTVLFGRISIDQVMVLYLTWYVAFHDASVFWEFFYVSVDRDKNIDKTNADFQLEAVLTYCLIPLSNLFMSCVFHILNIFWQNIKFVIKSLQRLFTQKILCIKYWCWNIGHAIAFGFLVSTIFGCLYFTIYDTIYNHDIDGTATRVIVRSEEILFQPNDNRVVFKMYQGEDLDVPKYFMNDGTVLIREFRMLSVSDSGIYDLVDCRNRSPVHRGNNRFALMCNRVNVNLTVKYEDRAYIYPNHGGQYYKIVYPFHTAFANETLTVKYTVNNVDVHDVCTQNFIYCSFEAWLRTYFVEEERVEIVAPKEVKHGVYRHLIVLNACMCNAMYGVHQLTIYRKSSDDDFEEIKYALKLYVVPDNTKDVFIDEAVRYFNFSDTLPLHIPFLSKRVEINIVHFLNNFCLYLSYIVCLVALYAIDRFFKWYCSIVYNPITNFVLTGRWSRTLLSLETQSFAGIENVVHFQYDVFMSSCESVGDAKFACNVLLPFLETNCRRRVCFPTRDHAHLGGANLLNMYLSAVRQSRKFVVVLSRDYLEDDTCNKLQLERSILPLMTSGDILGQDLIIIRVDTADVPVQVRHWPDVHVLDWTEADRNTFNEARLRELLNM